MAQLMSVMRCIDCTIDLFSDISKIAILARTPFLLCTERSRYVDGRDGEILDISAKNIEKQTVFTFPNVIETGNINSWFTNLIELILSKLDKVPFGKELLPGTELTLEQDINQIKKNRVNRFGARFIKVPKV